MYRIFTLALAGMMAKALPAAADSYQLTTGNDYRPFIDEELPQGGMVTEIVRVAYENAGHEVSIDFIPWKRGARLVHDGKYTATFGYVKTDDRLKKWLFSDPVVTFGDRPVVAADSDISVKNLEDFKGLTSCLPVGWSTLDKIQKMIDAGEMKQSNPRNLESCFKLLKRGRVDVVVMDKPTAAATASQVLGSTDSVAFEPFVLNQTSIHTIFSKKSDTAQADRDTFNEALYQRQ